MRVLVIEDEKRLAENVARSLRENTSCAVDVAFDGEEGLFLAESSPYDLIVLDLMLPGEDGLTYCRRLRGNGDRIPVIMLTARSDEIDRIVGLEIGADDYLPKPGNPRELLARIRAVLRRRAAVQPGAPQAELGEIPFGDCVLDAAARNLRRGDEVTRLTSGEFALLSVFVRFPNQPLSRDRLVSLARGRGQEPFERSIDVTISRLRKLIEKDPKNPRHLQTVWGVGYVFVPR